MHSFLKRATLSLCALRSSLVSSKRSPTVAAVRASSAKWAYPIRPKSNRALAQAPFLFASANPVGGCATRQMTVGLDPGNRAVETLLVVLVGLGKLSRDRGELAIDHIDSRLYSISFAPSSAPDAPPPLPTVMMPLYEQ